MTLNFDDIPEIALAWHQNGRGAVLATVVETWGSAPRPVGSQLAISGDGELAGSVSGGCVEGAVVLEAQDALAQGTSQILDYGISDDEAFAVGLACGGRIRVLLEPVGQAIPVPLLQTLVETRAQRRPVAYVVNTENWQRQLIDPENTTSDASLGPNLSANLRQAFQSDKSTFDGARFLAIHNPPLRMVVVGAVHIAQPLMILARMAGYDAVLVDPRPAFAAQSRFPGEKIIDEWPDEALIAHGLDRRTAVVTLTHDPKLDDPAIGIALQSDVFYLGCLGSKRTHAKRRTRFTKQGVSDTVLDRIHAPVGLDIGAKSPTEIAISIMGEITQTLRQL